MKNGLRVSLLALIGAAGVSAAHASVSLEHGRSASGMAAGQSPAVSVAVNRAAWGYATPAKFSSLPTHGTDVAVNRAAWGYVTKGIG